MVDSSANKRLAKNSLYMSIQMVMVLLVTLYTTRAVLSVLGVEDYGIYNVVAGFVTMFSFLNNSMASAVQRYYNFELGKNGEEGACVVYNAAFRIHVILGVILVLATELIGLWYLNHKMIIPNGRLFAANWIFHFSVISLFFNVIMVPYVAAVMAHEKMSYYASLGVLDAFLKLAIVLVLPFLSNDRLILYGVFFLCITIFNYILYYYYCKTNFKEIHLLSKVPKKMFKDLLSFSGWGVFGSLAYLLREQGINLLLNAFFGTVVNAARGVANQVNGALQGFISSLVTPSRPQVIQSYSQGNLVRTWNITFLVSKVTCLFFFSMALPICIEVKYILNFWLGETVPNHTEMFIIIMLLTNTFGTLVSPVSTVMHATGNIKFYQTISSVSNLMTVPLAFVFLLVEKVPEYVFIALFITMITNLLAGLVSANKYAQLTYRTYVKLVLLPCVIVMLITFPLAIIPVFVLDTGFLRVLSECFWCFGLVLFFSYFVAFRGEERKVISQLVGKVFFRNV